jgi:hypothetical protein
MGELRVAVRASHAPGGTPDAPAARGMTQPALARLMISATVSFSESSGIEPVSTSARSASITRVRISGHSGVGRHAGCNKRVVAQTPGGRASNTAHRCNALHRSRSCRRCQLAWSR